MAIKFETLAPLWKTLDLRSRLILLYLARHTDWTDRFAGAKEIAEGAGLTTTEVRRWIAPLEGLKLIERKGESTARWAATPVILRVDEARANVDAIKMREALIDLGIIEPEPAVDVRLRLRFDLAHSTAAKLAPIFPSFRHDPERVSARAALNLESLGNAIDRLLPGLLDRPEVIERLREIQFELDAEYDQHLREEREEEAKREFWRSANPGKSWEEERIRREEETEHRRRAEERMRLGVEAQLEPDPERYFAW